MTNVQNGFDPQVQDEGVPQDQHQRGIRTGQTALLLALLAATGAAWWTMQDRNDAIATSPSLTSTEPLPVPFDEATIATESTPARIAPATKATPSALRDRGPTLIASSQVSRVRREGFSNSRMR